MIEQLPESAGRKPGNTTPPRVVSDGKSHRWEGFLLVAVYAGVAFGFYVAGDR